MPKTPKTKICSKCGRRKQVRYFHKEADRKDGIATSCKKCRNAASHQWFLDNKVPKADYNRRSILRKKYGITLEQYEAMLKAQKGVCAICGHPPKTRRLDVDHCHKTKRVRGLLCFACNQALGYLRNDPARARAAARFLARKVALGLVY